LSCADLGKAPIATRIQVDRKCFLFGVWVFFFVEISSKLVFLELTNRKKSFVAVATWA
jgi:hypothetical protein